MGWRRNPGERLHPNSVFDTALWTDEVAGVARRAYGMSVDYIAGNNVLRTDVRSSGRCEHGRGNVRSLFARTTGAQVPVDGGNDRVI